MYLKYDIQEFKAFCVNHKAELKKVDFLRIITYKGTTFHETLKSFGEKILELEKRGLKSVQINSIFDHAKNYNGNAYKTADVFFDLFISGKIATIEFTTGF